MYIYHVMRQTMSRPELGQYISFGILALCVQFGCHQPLRYVADVSPDEHFVETLAARCTAQQLDPSQLLDVVEDAII